MAAKTDTREVEILLESLDVSNRIAMRESTHIANFVLIWPRVSVASKESTPTLHLQKGKLDYTKAPWHKRILLKEKVENHFAISLHLTESLLAQKVTDFMRFVISGVAKIAGSQVDTFFGGSIGDLASLPWEYAQKRFKEKVNANIIAEGTLELDADALGEEQCFTIKLVAPEEVVKTEETGSGRGHGIRRKILFKKGGEVGNAVVRVRPLS